MGDCFDLLARRRAEQKRNPTLSAKQLNDQYCIQNKLPVFTKQSKGMVQETEFTAAEKSKIDMESEIEKIKLYNRVKSCGESGIGRKPTDGKHGIIMGIEEEKQPEVPEFKSEAERSRYLYNLHNQRMIADKRENELLKDTLGKHLMHGLVDQKSITGHAILDESKNASMPPIRDIKADLIANHQMMYQSADYQNVAKIRKLRVVDQNDDSELSKSQLDALNSNLMTTAAAIKTQEMGYESE